MARKPVQLEKMPTFEVDEGSSVPVWVQMKNRFIHLIVSGYYMPGDHLPTVRGLAADIGVNYNTVSKVYQSLEEDGYIVSKRRQGAFVLDVSGMSEADPGATGEMMAADYINRCLELGMTLEDIEEQFNRRMRSEKDRRARAKRSGNGQKPQEGEDTGPAGSGRVVVFPGYADKDGRTAGNGA